jgi:hypothetical protein
MVNRILVCLLIVLSMLAWYVSPVLAIADPDSLPEIRSSYAFQDLLEPDDMGFLLDYNLDYAALPTETATESFVVALLDDTGAQLKAVAPVAFTANLNKGYRRGASWLYFSAADVTTLGLTWSSNYTIQLVGNPALVWPGAPPTTYTAPGDLVWFPTDGTTANQAALAVQILTYGDLYETAWTMSITTVTSLGKRLDTYGEEYFGLVIPNVRDVAPGAFASSEASPVYENLDYTTSFNGTVSSLTGTVNGSPVTLNTGTNNINITALGTISVLLGRGKEGIVDSDVATVAGAPVSVSYGTSTITVGGIVGNIIITISDVTTQSNILSGLIGSPLDLTALGAAFGMSRAMISALLWFGGMGVLLYYCVKYLGTKIAIVFADFLIVAGGLLGMLTVQLTIGLFIGAIFLTGFVLFYNRSSA